MRILVTGSEGFIGKHLVRKYRELGHAVIGFDPKDWRLTEAISVIDCQRQRSLIEKAIELFRPELVNHQGADSSVTKSIEDPGWNCENNLLQTIVLLEACRKFEVKKVIFASSGGAVYGEQELWQTDPLEDLLACRENFPKKPISPYGINKLAAEHYLRFYKEVHGLKYVALRYANVYGPGCHGAVANFAKLIAEDKPIEINGSGEQTRDYVYIDDVVEANVEALNPEIEGAFNIGTGKETSINELAAEISQIIGKGYSVVNKPEIKGEVKRNCLRPSTIQKRVTQLREGLLKTIPSLAS